MDDLPVRIYYVKSMGKNRTYHTMSGLASFVLNNHHWRVFLLEPGQPWVEITQYIKGRYDA